MCYVRSGRQVRRVRRVYGELCASNAIEAKGNGRAHEGKFDEIPTEAKVLV